MRLCIFGQPTVGKTFAADKLRQTSFVVTDSDFLIKALYPRCWAQRDWEEVSWDHAAGLMRSICIEQGVDVIVTNTAQCAFAVQGAGYEVRAYAVSPDIAAARYKARDESKRRSNYVPVTSEQYLERARRHYDKTVTAARLYGWPLTVIDRADKYLSGALAEDLDLDILRP